MGMFESSCVHWRKQRGAALFVGLILLILLALIGLAAMQSTLLQERMAGNFRLVNLAFQNAEETLRLAEGRIQADVNANRAHAPDAIDCGTINYDAWIATQAATGTPRSRSQKVDQCIATWTGGEFGQPRNVKIDDMYRVSSFAPDRAGSTAATAVVETIYIP